MADSAAERGQLRLVEIQLLASVRVAVATAAAGVLILAFVFELSERYVLQVAPQCAGVTADNACVLRVSAVPDTVFAVSLLAFAALLALVAISGRVPLITKDGFDFRGPAAIEDSSFVSENEASGSYRVGGAPRPVVRSDAETATQVDGNQNQAFTLATLLSELRAQQEQDDTWTQIPEDVRDAAQEAWAASYPDVALRDAFVQVRRKSGQGPNAWFIEASTPNGSTEWVRVALSGRGVHSPRGAISEGPVDN